MVTIWEETKDAASSEVSTCAVDQLLQLGVMSALEKTPRAYSAASLAKLWGCSERHIRNMVADGRLRGFRLGGKLLRIPVDAVEEFERASTVGIVDLDHVDTVIPPQEKPRKGGPLQRARLARLRAISRG